MQDKINLILGFTLYLCVILLFNCSIPENPLTPTLTPTPIPTDSPVFHIFHNNKLSRVTSKINLDAGRTDYSKIFWRKETNEYNFIWQDWLFNGPDTMYGSYQYFFGRIDCNGNRIGNDIRITEAGKPAWLIAAIWNEYDYTIVWESNLIIYFMKIDSMGNITQTPKSIAFNWIEGISLPSIIKVDNEYALIYGDGSDIYLRKIDKDGNMIANEAKIFNVGIDSKTGNTQALRQFKTVWTGTEYGITCGLARHGGVDSSYYESVIFICLSAEFKKIGDAVNLTDNAVLYADISLTWTGNEYGIVWAEEGGSYMTDINFARIDSNGNKIGDNQTISNHIGPGNMGHSRDPGIYWGNENYFIIYEDSRNGNHLYYAVLNSDGKEIINETCLTRPIQTFFCSHPSVIWDGTGFVVSWTAEYEFPNTDIYFYF